ncbi:MAG: DUF4783 domain-containing protein [Bacteroidota bacterium]
MKYTTSIIATLLFAVLLSGVPANLQAQLPDGTVSSIGTAIKASDADALARNFNSSLEVTLPGVDKTFSAQQATFVLKEFFASHPVRSFRILHKGSSGATHYMTGLCVTGKGEYDTNVFLKKFGDRYLITQIRFEAD